MIVLWTGAPGSGKSYSAVQLIVDALESGKAVATNVDLVDGWALRAAKGNPLRRCVPGRCARVAAEWEARTLVSADLDELFRVRVHSRKEGSLRLVLDEAHNWVNSRTWDSDGGEGGKTAAVSRRLRVVRYFSQHRKHRADVYLITQSAESIDAQIRRLFEFHVTLRNLRRFRFCGVPVVPFNCFLAIWRWNDPGKSVTRRQLFRLRRRYARLYDTLAVSHGEELERDLIYLGPAPSGRPALPPPTDVDGQAASAPADRSAAPAQLPPPTGRHARAEGASGTAASPAAATEGPQAT